MDQLKGTGENLEDVHVVGAESVSTTTSASEDSEGSIDDDSQSDDDQAG